MDVTTPEWNEPETPSSVELSMNAETPKRSHLTNPLAPSDIVPPSSEERADTQAQEKPANEEEASTDAWWDDPDIADFAFGPSSDDDSDEAEPGRLGSGSGSDNDSLEDENVLLDLCDAHFLEVGATFAESQEVDGALR